MISSKEIQAMTLADLNKLHDKIAEVLPAQKREAINQARQELMASAKKLGLNPDEVLLKRRPGRPRKAT